MELGRRMRTLTSCPNVPTHGGLSCICEAEAILNCLKLKQLCFVGGSNDHASVHTLCGKLFGAEGLQAITYHLCQLGPRIWSYPRDRTQCSSLSTRPSCYSFFRTAV